MEPMTRFAPLALCSALLWPAAGFEPAPSAPLGPLAVLEEPTEIEILDLTGIDWRPGQPLPDRVQALDGRRVLIRGYMHQSVTDNVNLFPMVSDACQCVGVLLPHHFIEVNLGPRTTGPIPGCFEVVGTLSVGELEVDGFIHSVYRLKGRIF